MTSVLCVFIASLFQQEKLVACKGVCKITKWFERGTIEYLNHFEINIWQNGYAKPHPDDESEQIIRPMLLLLLLLLLFIVVKLLL